MKGSITKFGIVGHKATRLRFIAIITVTLAMASSSIAIQQGWMRALYLKKNGAPATLNAIAFDGDRIWVVGANGYIGRSTNDGASFQESNSGASNGLNDVFIRKDRIWIVGDEGYIVNSTDKGLSFTHSSYDSSR